MNGPERVMLPAIRYVENGVVRVMVPLTDGERGWWQLNNDGASFFRTAAEVRRFAEEWHAELLVDGGEVEPSEREAIAAYLALADLIDELEQSAPPSTIG